MLISHIHHFIFVHIYKNAGTSISTALFPFATRNPVHRMAVRLAHKLNVRLPGNLDPFLMESHVSASQIVERLGQEKFDSYFSFAFVRNPWDWQVSLFTFMRKYSGHPQHNLIMSFADFDEYIRWRCKWEVRYQKDFVYSVNGKQLVDFIGKYEHLKDDFSYVCLRCGIQADLPELNVSKALPYQNYYTPDTVELVRQTFAQDILAFDYDFGKIDNP